MINKTILWCVSLSFLPFVIHIGVGIRFFDILFLLTFILYFFILKKRSIVINKFTIFLFTMFTFSFISMIGIYTIQNLNEPLFFHIKNIMMGSFRYIEILVIFNFLYFSNDFLKRELLKHIVYGIILNDIYGIVSYLIKIYDVGNNISSLLITGRFIYNFRYLESVYSVNGSAGFLVMTLPLLWYGNRYFSKFIWLVFLFLHFILLFLTASKSAFLGILLFFILLFIFDKKTNIFRISYYSLIFIAFLTFVWSTIPEPIKKYRIEGMLKGDKSTTERVVRAKKSLNILIENPIFGYGFSSTYKYLFEKYAEGKERNWIRGVSGHNTYVTLLVQIGIFGFFFFILFMIILLIESIKILLKRKQDSLYYLSISIILFFIVSATDDMLFIPLNFFVFFLIILLFYIYKKRLVYAYFNNNSII